MTATDGFKDLVVETPGVDFRVHRSVFTDERYLEREKKTIFSNNWLYIGHASEIPNNGDFLTRTVVGEKLILCRDKSGEVRVFFNSCRHRGALVCREPSGNAANFRCLYHAWTYRNSGELIGIAERTSFPEGFNLAESGLDSPRCEIYRDFVFVTFSAEAPSLREHLEPVLPYLDSIIDQSITGEMEVVQGSHLYRMGGNWKLIVENSLDGYHGLAVHETYFKYLGKRGYDLSGGLDGVGLNLGNGHAMIKYKAPFGRSVAKPAVVMSEQAKERVGELAAELVDKHGAETADLISQTSKNILIYPNLLIIDAASLQIRMLDPIAVDNTDVSAWCLGPVGEGAELRKHRIQGYLEFLGPGGFATPDDNEVIEACQEGYGEGRGTEWNIVSKGIGKEVPGVTDEEQMRAFWRQWQNDVAVSEETATGVGGGL
ncbi:MAG: Rieske 2Fe-2S domain-containing protein [Rhodococcus sp. (in: high G+C Gram-positive bacteria)]|uniref:aromatic ring-hydroxylating oxygenase subunit alpha n=1 Tax=Rhodococcus sp. TaxID=1831 RepID=UPI003BAF1458